LHYSMGLPGDRGFGTDSFFCHAAYYFSTANKHSDTRPVAGVLFPGNKADRREPFREITPRLQAELS
jgi:hypothetical protein